MENKVALVTGGSRGIGLGVVETLIENGAKVAIIASSPIPLEKTVEMLKDRYGVSVLGVSCNVASFDEVLATAKTIEQSLGPIEILVNNAGITQDALFARMNEKQWDDVINVNLKGVFNCTKAVFRSMMKRRFGRIVNITSVVGLTGNIGQANYAASKAGVIGFTKTIAKEGAPYGILCNAVAPGFIKTQMTDAISEKVQEMMLAQIPLGDFGNTDDVASAVAFLASKTNRYITGQVLNVDGGIAM